MGSIRRRIKNLERHYLDDAWRNEEAMRQVTEERDAEVMRKLRRVIDQAEARGEPYPLTAEEDEAAVEELRRAITNARLA